MATARTSNVSAFYAVITDNAFSAPGTDVVCVFTSENLDELEHSRYWDPSDDYITLSRNANEMTRQASIILESQFDDTEIDAAIYRVNPRPLQ